MNDSGHGMAREPVLPEKRVGRMLGRDVLDDGLVPWPGGEEEIGRWGNELTVLIFKIGRPAGAGAGGVKACRRLRLANESELERKEGKETQTNQPIRVGWERQTERYGRQRVFMRR